MYFFRIYFSLHIFTRSFRLLEIVWGLGEMHLFNELLLLTLRIYDVLLIFLCFIFSFLFRFLLSCVFLVPFFCVVIFFLDLCCFSYIIIFLLLLFSCQASFAFVFYFAFFHFFWYFLYCCSLCCHCSSLLTHF